MVFDRQMLSRLTRGISSMSRRSVVVGEDNLLSPSLDEGASY